MLAFRFFDSGRATADIRSVIIHSAECVCDLLKNKQEKWLLFRSSEEEERGVDTRKNKRGGRGVGKASGELLKIFSDDHSEWRIVGAIRRFLQLQGL